MTRLIGRRTARGVGVTVLGVAVGLAGLAAAAAAQAMTGPHASAASAAAVPAGFKANSITWVSPAQGWVLGAAPCGRKTCSYVIGTTNGAKTWKLLSKVSAPIGTAGVLNPKPGITTIRFATAKVGWIFGDRLFRTTNGGRSWASMPIPGKGKAVDSLAANSARAYVVVTTCPWATFCYTPYTFWRTATLTSTSWARISLTLPPSTGTDVAVHGKTVYLVDPEGGYAGAKNKFYASTDGLHFSARPVPCAAPWPMPLAVPTSATRVALLCVANPGFGGADKSVYRSVNTGKTDTYAGTTGRGGIGASLAASPSGNLAVASVSPYAASQLYINDTLKTTWTMVIDKPNDGGAGWGDLTYVTNTEAWVIYGPPDGATDIGQLLVTRDGGHHWSAVRI